MHPACNANIRIMHVPDIQSVAQVLAGEQQISSANRQLKELHQEAARRKEMLACYFQRCNTGYSCFDRNIIMKVSKIEMDFPCL